MDIDLYEFKETLKEFDDDNFVSFSEDKGVSVIEVGKTTAEMDKKLVSMGYKQGDRVLVVGQ